MSFVKDSIVAKNDVIILLKLVKKIVTISQQGVDGGG